MNDIIQLKLSTEEHNYLRKLPKLDGSESFTYKLCTSNPSIEAGFLGNSKYIRPAGGPVITENDFLEEAEAIVDHINYVMGYGYVVSFRISEDKNLIRSVLEL